MARNISVAWLSQSSQHDCRSGIEGALVHNPAAHELQTKHAHIGRAGVLTDDDVKDVTKIPSSPTRYTLASESEVGDENEEELGPNLRVRTKFTSYQIARLEKTFYMHKYLGASQRRKIAEKLHLSETLNRRMKLKREAQDTRVEYYASTLLAALGFHRRRFSTMGLLDSDSLSDLLPCSRIHSNLTAQCLCTSTQHTKQ